MIKITTRISIRVKPSWCVNRRATYSRLSAAPSASWRGCFTSAGGGGRTGSERPPHMRTCVRMVVCVLFSRFALVAALGDRRELMGEPVALAPEAGRRQGVGEVSPAAEAFGGGPGMRGGGALARWPELRLGPPHARGGGPPWGAPP